MELQLERGVMRFYRHREGFGFVIPDKVPLKLPRGKSREVLCHIGQAKIVALREDRNGKAYPTLVEGRLRRPPRNQGGDRIAYTYLMTDRGMRATAWTYEDDWENELKLVGHVLMPPVDIILSAGRMNSAKIAQQRDRERRRTIRALPPIDL